MTTFPIVVLPPSSNSFAVERIAPMLRQSNRLCKRGYATILKGQRGTAESPLRIGLIPADGIGNEVIPAAQKVVSALPGITTSYRHLDAGFDFFLKAGTALPESTLDALRNQVDCALFGAVSSPTRKVMGYTSPIVKLRKELGLFANIRPVQGTWQAKPVDLVIVRENTECLYVKEEHSTTDAEGNVTAEAIRRITSKASKRIASIAFALAAQRAKKDATVTVVHKSNVLQITDGLFRTSCREVYEQDGWEAKGVKYNEQIVDSMVYKLFREPWQFDVVVAPNLYGDILSDGAAALVGSLGVVPSINLSPNFVIGEPVHGSAPDIQGKGIANPIAAIRSAGMMLAQLGWVEEGDVIENAVRKTLEAGILTPDLGGKNSTDDLTNAVIERLS